VPNNPLPWLESYSASGQAAPLREESAFRAGLADSPKVGPNLVAHTRRLITVSAGWCPLVRNPAPAALPALNRTIGKCREGNLPRFSGGESWSSLPGTRELAEPYAMRI
jgi:hypothetical protein